MGTLVVSLRLGMEGSWWDFLWTCWTCTHVHLASTHTYRLRERDTIFKIESTMTLDTSSSSHLPHYPQARVLSHESHKHVVMVIGGQGRVEHKVSREFKGLGGRKYCASAWCLRMQCRWHGGNLLPLECGKCGFNATWCHWHGVNVASLACSEGSLSCSCRWAFNSSDGLDTV